MSHNTLRIYQYHIWANARVMSRLKEIPREAVHQEIQSVFPSIYEALVHMYRVDNVWFAGMSGAQMEEMKVILERVHTETSGKSLEDLEAAYNRHYEQQLAFLKSRDTEEIVSFPHPIYGLLRASYGDAIQHLVNHGTYHRGNITAMLRQLGYEGASSDYVFYLYSLNQ